MLLCCFMLLIHFEAFAFSRALPGGGMLDKIAMIAITTRSSISVNFFLFIILNLYWFDDYFNMNFLRPIPN